MTERKDIEKFICDTVDKESENFSADAIDFVKQNKEDVAFLLEITKKLDEYYPIKFCQFISMFIKLYARHNNILLDDLMTALMNVLSAITAIAKSEVKE